MRESHISHMRMEKDRATEIKAYLSWEALEGLAGHRHREIGGKLRLRELRREEYYF